MIFQSNEQSGALLDRAEVRIKSLNSVLRLVFVGEFTHEI